jgi:Mrp family chromosome partitioning ATPase
MTRALSSEQFQMLRARIETAVSMPCVLLVTSACPGDGESVCAFGLAKSLADAGYRTALVDINHVKSHFGSVRLRVPHFRGVPQPASLSSVVVDGVERYAVRDPETNLVLLSLAKESVAGSASKETVAATLNILRDRYDIAIIDAPRMLDSNLALLFAGATDGVLLTLCEGRSVASDDEATLELLTQSQAKVVGVVMISPVTIAAFTGRNHKEEASSVWSAAALGAVEAPHRVRG